MNLNEYILALTESKAFNKLSQTEQLLALRSAVDRYENI